MRKRLSKLEKEVSHGRVFKKETTDANRYIKIICENLRKSVVKNIFFNLAYKIKSKKNSLIKNKIAFFYLNSYWMQ